MADKLVNIDGSVLEGGGQILRITLTLSALCGIPVRVYNIRVGRSKPGLAPQHLTGFKLVQEMTDARVKGDELGSTEIEFWPTCLKGGFYTADPQTAGSICLLLQVALPCTFFTNSEVTLKLRGGTNAEMAPQIDYITEVFRPILEKFDATFDFDLKRRGYFPKGGGEVRIHTAPIKCLNPITLLDRGDIKTIYGWSYVAGTLPIHMAHKMADSATKLITQHYPQTKINIERYKERPEMAIGNCFGIILVAETTTGCIIGSSGLGKRSITPEDTGTTAGQELVNNLLEGACVDNHAQDQIVIFMALANGTSSVRIGKMTQHTETAIYIVEKMTNAKFEVINEGTTNVLKCEGIKLINKFL